MKYVSKKASKLIVIVAITVLCVSTSWSNELVFTAIPDQDTSRLEQRFGKIADYLSKELDIEVRYIPVKSYSASVQAFKNNEVQLAWFGGLSGVQARLGVPGSVAIAQGVEDPYFISYFIANTSTGLSFSEKFPKDIAGKTFTFGSKGSTSGRLMPEFFIREAFEKIPDDIFKRVGFSGDHSKTLALVQSGSYEVGAMNYKVWRKEVEAGKVDPTKVQVIWRTPPYPDYNWTIRGDVDKTFGDGFTKKIQQAITDIDDPAILEAFPRASFIPANNSLYQPILDTAIEVGIIRK
ncbi:MAG: putative selenate ABC transporter substrate-binding protein [Candidatus Poribacteria bacterium]|nr:putative selenate ABC transporter substrate-binding protein [Candidatus Poribacteria bacterium]MDE0504121.1 putative selenate ABC transporter substrate-binding protein [Candidatus Poribacteria bacterium]